MRVKFIGNSDLLALINGKVYEVLSVDQEWFRIVDETGEDYLFQPDLFEGVPE